jgi:hypothetical protein
MSIEFRTFDELDPKLLAAAYDAAFAPRTRTAVAWSHARGDGAVARLEGIAALQEGRVVAAYASCSMRGICQANATRLGQVVDSFVTPEVRGTLGAARLLVQCGERHFARHGGADTTAFHYGWPIEAVRPLGEAHLGYVPLRREVVLYSELSGSESCPGEVQVGGDVEERLSDGQAVHDELWERLARERAIAVSHDAAWLRWRVREHPHTSYERLVVRHADGRLAGAVVLAASDAWHPRTIAIADWLVPETESSAAALLVAAARARAAAAGAKVLLALVPTRSAAFDVLQQLQLKPHDSGRYLCVRSFDARVGERDLRAGLWTTMLDSDLV